MKAKKNRLQVLRALIESRDLTNQREVLNALAVEGYALTQGTLSRDMKLLGITKKSGENGRSTYQLPERTGYKRVSEVTLKSVAHHSGVLESVNFSDNVCVIKTRPGHAGSVAYNIDNGDMQDILGTIAGDDTIFAVLRKGASYEDVVSELAKIIPNI